MIPCTRRRDVRRWIALPAVFVLLMGGCSRMQDTDSNYSRAIDKYYDDHPSCLFREPVKFPADTDDPKQRKRLDALVDGKLLTRSGPEKRVMVVAAGQMNQYELSPTGHADWVADTKQPGYGNLCYGHRKVVAIDSSAPTTSSEGARTTVVYRYTVQEVPSWAKTAELQKAFPELLADLSGKQVGRASLMDTKKGWEVRGASWAHIDDSDIYK